MQQLLENGVSGDRIIHVIPCDRTHPFATNFINEQVRIFIMKSSQYVYLYLTDGDL